MAPEKPLTQDDGVFHLWPDNEPMWQLWLKLQTQWNFNMESPTGLDYAGVDVVLGKLITGRRQRKTAFLLMQDLERTTLNALDENREKKKD